MLAGYIIIGVMVALMLVDLMGILQKRKPKQTPLEEHLNRVEKAQLLTRLKLERVRRERLAAAEEPRRGDVVPVARARRA